MLYEKITYLIYTYLILINYHQNHKLYNNIKTLFETYDYSDITDTRCVNLIKMIQRAIKAIDIGINDTADAIFKFSMEDASDEDTIDIENRLNEELHPDLISEMADFYGSYVSYGSLFENHAEFNETMNMIQTGGVSVANKNFKKLASIIGKMNNQIEEALSGVQHEELVITQDVSIGLKKLIKDRDIENSFVIKLFPAFDFLLGGGLRARKTYLLNGVTGGFKSGTLLNIACYGRENGYVPKEFLGNLKPCILYITHENTITQTTDRVMRWNGLDKKTVKELPPDEYSKNISLMIGEHDTTGITLAVKFYKSKELTVKAIRKVCIDYERILGLKIVCIIEDYAAHLAVSLTDDEKIDKTLSGDKIARDLNDLSKIVFAPVVTAGQYNREGEKNLNNYKLKHIDYLKYMNRSDLAGSYNATHAYESIFFVDRSKVTGTNTEFLSVKLDKDRDNDNDESNYGQINGKTFGNYMVIPFKDDGVGFRLDDKKVHASIEELSPTSEIFDSFNRLSEETRKEREREKKLRDAAKILENHGYLLDVIDAMDDITKLNKAQEILKLNEAKKSS